MSGIWPIRKDSARQPWLAEIWLGGSGVLKLGSKHEVNPVASGEGCASRDIQTVVVRDLVSLEHVVDGPQADPETLSGTSTVTLACTESVNE